MKSKGNSVLKTLNEGKNVHDGWYTAKYPKRTDVKKWVLRIAYPQNPPPGYIEKLLEIGDDAETMGITVFLHPISG